MEWVLILTVAFGAQGTNLPAATTIEAIPDFASETVCQQAGEKWLASMKGNKKNYMGSSFYTCVIRS